MRVVSEQTAAGAGEHPTLVRLRAEAAALDRDPPAFLTRLSAPVPAPCVNGADGSVLPPPDDGRDGPWVIDARIRGPADSAYDQEVSVRLCIPADYPDPGSGRQTQTGQRLKAAPSAAGLPG